MAPQAKEIIFAQSSSTSETADQAASNKLFYEEHFPGMTQEQIEAVSKSRLSDYKRHELAIEVDLPGDLSVDKKGKLQLQGTGSIFDTTYDIDSIEFDYQAGENGNFSMSIWGKTAGDHASQKKLLGG